MNITDLENKHMIIKVNQWPDGPKDVSVIPISPIEKRASGLEYLKVRSVFGYPFTENAGGVGESVFHNDLEWCNEKYVLATPAVKEQYEKYIQAQDKERAEEYDQYADYILERRHNNQL